MQLGKTTTRRWPRFATQLLLLAVTLFLALIGIAIASGKKDVRDAVLQLAGSLAKKDRAAAQRQARALSRQITDVQEVMNLFRFRKHGGLGVGATPGAIQPDCLEALWGRLAVKPLPQEQLDREAASLTQAAYVTAAIAQVAHHKIPENIPGDRRKEWPTLTEEMQRAALELAEEIKARNPRSVRDRSRKLNDTCANCHTIYEEGP